MKSKNYKHGKVNYKTYCKNVGHGYEVGIICKGKPLFVGNFLKSAEANQWYTKMNQEIATFAKRYWATEETPVAFYTKFLSNHIYTCYYNFINKIVPRNNKVYVREFNKSLRAYKKKQVNWYPSEKLPLKKSA